MLRFDRAVVYVSALFMGTAAAYGLLVAGIEHLPRETISCAGIPNCETKRFEIGEGRYAYCAIWKSGNQSKCAVDKAQ